MEQIKRVGSIIPRKPANRKCHFMLLLHLGSPQQQGVWPQPTCLVQPLFPTGKGEPPLLPAFAEPPLLLLLLCVPAFAADSFTSLALISPTAH